MKRMGWNGTTNQGRIADLIRFASHAQGPRTTIQKQGRPTILVALLCYEQSIVTAWMSILVQLGTLCYDLSSSPSHMNLLHRISWWLMHRAFNSFGTS
jgi:hypothetical protein